MLCWPWRCCSSASAPPAIELRFNFPLGVLAGEATSAHRGHICPALVEVDSLIDRLDLEKIFGRKAPLHIDLGCGDGSFICALAQRLPDKNFLGIERLSGRVQSAARKAASL